MKKPTAHVCWLNSYNSSFNGMIFSSNTCFQNLLNIGPNFRGFAPGWSNLNFSKSLLLRIPLILGCYQSSVCIEQQIDEAHAH